MKRLLTPILWTALIAGSLDIAAAMLKYFLSTGKDPTAVLRFIASGVLGRDAFSGGILSALFGLLLHFIIAGSWTALYFFLFPRLQFLSRNKYLSGILYGIIVWCGMNLVVLPFSRVAMRPFDLFNAIEGIVILMVCIGIPVSLSAHRYFTKKGG
jgi:hypothetical protein